MIGTAVQACQLLWTLFSCRREVSRQQAAWAAVRLAFETFCSRARYNFWASVETATSAADCAADHRRIARATRAHEHRPRPPEQTSVFPTVSFAAQVVDLAVAVVVGGATLNLVNAMVSTHLAFGRPNACDKTLNDL